MNDPPFLNRKRILAWCLYDFANSSYSAVIAAVVFPVYYTKVIVGNAAGLGDLWWGRAISTSMLIVAVTSPLLGGIADATSGRRRFLMTYTLLSVGSVALLALLQPGMVLPGFLLMVLANAGMEGGLVFYNAYLPDLTPRDRIGRVSAWGFGLGYAGSLLSLLLALPLVDAGRFSTVWVVVAVFYGFFSIPLFAVTTPQGGGRSGGWQGAIAGARETLRVLSSLWRRRDARRFLLAFFFYQDGVNTVIVFSSIFAASTLGFETRELVILYMVVQAAALFGSFLLARPIDRQGPGAVIRFSLLLWIGVTVSSYFIESKELFWAVACVAGLGLGSIQAASRALYCRVIPGDEEAGHFGVYALVGKTSAIMGPLVFGTVSHALGSQRPAILSVALFFVVGFFLLSTVRDELTGSAATG